MAVSPVLGLRPSLSVFDNLVKVPNRLSFTCPSIIRAEPIKPKISSTMVLASGEVRLLFFLTASVRSSRVIVLVNCVYSMFNGRD